MLHFVTNSNSTYIIKAACLIQSFLDHQKEGRLWFCAMDQEAENTIRKLNFPNVTVFSARDLENTELLSVKLTRSEKEYSQTCKPAALEHVLNAVNTDDWVLWIDADMMFLSDITAALPTKNASVLITPHHYSAQFKKFEDSVGYINTGFVGFRKDLQGKAALEWWKKSCLDWCGLTPEKNRYTDQKYADEFRTRFDRVVEIKHLGINTAPWNSFDKKISQHNNTVFIENDPILLFHYQGFRQITASIFDIYADETIRVPSTLRSLIYAPYAKEMQKNSNKIIGLNKSNSQYLEGIHARFLAREVKKFLFGKSNLMILN